MEKRKFKLRYLYEGGATMEDFHDVPVTGIMLENGSRISVHYGSTANNRAADAEEANRTAEEYSLIDGSKREEAGPAAVVLKYR